MDILRDPFLGEGAPSGGKLISTTNQFRVQLRPKYGNFLLEVFITLPPKIAHSECAYLELFCFYCGLEQPSFI